MIWRLTIMPDQFLQLLLSGMLEQQLRRQGLLLMQLAVQDSWHFRNSCIICQAVIKHVQRSAFGSSRCHRNATCNLLKAAAVLGREAWDATDA